MMEAFALYLVKSVIWLSGFALVYLLFLKNERFFVLNRIFLISGILSAFLLPLLTIRYSVVIPVLSVVQPENAIVNGVENMAISDTPDTGSLLLILYLSGILFVAFMILNQSRSVLRSFKKAEIIISSPVKLVRTSDYASSFSFFSRVFVNPSVTDVEIREILNHEMVHIRQRHWIDLVLTGLLCMLQWFNPVVWIYVRFIRQNHEYIADKVALQRTSDPAIYKATLLNQIVGSPVVILANSFNYSLNKKRFTMMKNIISSPYRKMKILFILPVFAIVFYSFAKPDYQYSQPQGNSANQRAVAQSSDKNINGTIVQQNGIPLQGANVIVMGTTIGSTSDSKGYFSINNVPEDAAIVVSYIGYKSKIIKSEFVARAPIKMERDTISYLNSPVSMPPPPPSQSGLKIRSTENPPPPPPLIVVDGTITNRDVNTIDPETIVSIEVLKDKSATDKYGDKGKNGVIVITSKTKNSMSDVKLGEEATHEKPEEGIFVVVEELPEFPGGGRDAMRSWISQNLKYPGEAYSKKVTGTVDVGFLVTRKGKIKHVRVMKPVYPSLDAEAKRVIGRMPDWKPGIQHGKGVDVQMKVPVEFKLP